MSDLPIGNQNLVAFKSLTKIMRDERQNINVRGRGQKSIFPSKPF
jgi:hypothetical protein